MGKRRRYGRRRRRRQLLSTIVNKVVYKSAVRVASLPGTQNMSVLDRDPQGIMYRKYNSSTTTAMNFQGYFFADMTMYGMSDDFLSMLNGNPAGLS